MFDVPTQYYNCSQSLKDTEDTGGWDVVTNKALNVTHFKVWHGLVNHTKAARWSISMNAWGEVFWMGEKKNKSKLLPGREITSQKVFLQSWNTKVGPWGGAWSMTHAVFITTCLFLMLINNSTKSQIRLSQKKLNEE